MPTYVWQVVVRVVDTTDSGAVALTWRDAPATVAPTDEDREALKRIAEEAAAKVRQVLGRRAMIETAKAARN